MKPTFFVLMAALVLATGCGPTAEEQQAADQQRCSSFGYQPGSDAFAQCMMKIDSQRQAQAAADRRAAQERAAEDQRAQAALQAQQAQQQAAQEKAAQQAAAKSADSSSSPFGSSPVDDVRNKIQQDMDNIQNQQ
jgi:hypothetical protein